MAERGLRPGRRPAGGGGPVAERLALAAAAGHLPAGPERGAVSGQRGGGAAGGGGAAVALAHCVFAVGAGVFGGGGGLAGGRAGGGRAYGVQPGRQLRGGGHCGGRRVRHSLGGQLRLGPGQRARDGGAAGRPHGGARPAGTAGAVGAVLRHGAAISVRAAAARAAGRRAGAHARAALLARAQPLRLRHRPRAAGPPGRGGPHAALPGGVALHAGLPRRRPHPPRALGPGPRLRDCRRRRPHLPRPGPLARRFLRLQQARAGPRRRRGGGSRAAYRGQRHWGGEHPRQLGQHRGAAPRARPLHPAFAPAGPLRAREARRPGAPGRHRGDVRQLGPLTGAAPALSGASHALRGLKNNCLPAGVFRGRAGG